MMLTSVVEFLAITVGGCGADIRVGCTAGVETC